MLATLRARTRTKAGFLLALAAVIALTLVGVAAASVIRGTEGDDNLVGTAGPDVIRGLTGNDSLYGKNGRDYLSGGQGNDTLSGGPRGDTLRGRAGDDVLNGDQGADLLYGGQGADTENGGAGPDRLHALAKDGVVDHLDCGPGLDVARIIGNDTVLDETTHCERVVKVSSSAAEEPGDSPTDQNA